MRREEESTRGGEDSEYGGIRVLSSATEGGKTVLRREEERVNTRRATPNPAEYTGLDCVIHVSPQALLGIRVIVI